MKGLRFVVAQESRFQAWKCSYMGSAVLEGGNVFEVRNFGEMVISRKLSRPFRRKRTKAFSSSETSQNVHFANGNPAVSPLERKRFSGPVTSGKIVISGTVSRPFRRKRENAF